jgi:uncharacterized protein (TIGR00251 family)
VPGLRRGRLTLVSVVAHPAAARRRVQWDGQALQVWVTVPAADGRANRELLAAIADALGVPRARVELVRGTRSRHKLVQVAGLEPGDLATAPGINPPPRG